MQESQDQAENGVTYDFLAGGGEMGALMRKFDWSVTPLGVTSIWPQSLRSAISILLPSRAQIVLFWGSDLTTLYNEAYAVVLGSKHPWALGKPARECWAEIWEEVLSGLFARVLRTGDAFYAQDHPFFLERYGYLEETYFDVSYDPVRVESGAVGGIFCIVSETTGRVLGERRLLTLRDLGAEASKARSGEEACRVAMQTLSTNPSDIPFALLYFRDGAKAHLCATASLQAGGAASPSEVDLKAASGGCVWPLAEVFQSGRALLVEGLGEKVGVLPGGPWPESPREAFVVPIKLSAQENPAGVLVMGISPRRRFDDGYRSFLDLVTGHIATAIVNARAYEDERKRAEALAEIDRAKTTFFSNVSHEFRTPLTLMLGPLEDLLAKSEGSLPTEDRAQLAVAHRNSLRLLKLVNTLLDFSRIEAGRVRAAYEPTDLAACTSELASTFRSAIEKAGLRLIVDCPPLSETVYVDRDMWEKIVLNLLSNAFKFTFEGDIAVRLHQTGERVELSVRDTGTGIPEHELPHIFERFHRVQGARGRTYEGTGVGLALVQELIQLHGGSVKVDSVHNQGSTFTVSIPLGKSHLPADPAGSARMQATTALGAGPYVEEALRWLSSKHRMSCKSDDMLIGDELHLVNPSPNHQIGKVDKSTDQQISKSQQRPLILLADDNADMRDYVRRLLSERYEVEAVGDGEAALAAVRRNPPDLILTDVMMPRLDGVGLLNVLRADPRTSTIPIILLSARAGEESRVEGMEAGADDYLIKPFSAREVMARVSAHLDMARVRREAGREGERRFRAIADSAPVMIWTSGPDKHCDYVNQSWLNFTGRTMVQELSDGWKENVHPDDLPGCVRTYVTAFDARNTYQMEYRLRRFDGHYHWIVSHGAPRYGVDGNFIGYIGSCVDITDRKQHEDEIHKLNDALMGSVKDYERVVHALQQSRTELLDKIEDLETFEHAVIGRELKMIELEKQVEELRKQLSKSPAESTSPPH